ncbi:outer membrane transport energization protein TonB [Aquitalea magnusonii]|uniref:Outer membrane transport energization protein TonB n=1 Tax=Aquitalea magnusonii TaxID=332411 RepID=A0A318J3V1_9NEIS|nr:outer membrane transport energization protein TonB [Aquitalea magnusonii]
MGCHAVQPRHGGEQVDGVHMEGMAGAERSRVGVWLVVLLLHGVLGGWLARQTLQPAATPLPTSIAVQLLPTVAPEAPAQARPVSPTRQPPRPLPALSRHAAARPARAPAVLAATHAAGTTTTTAPAQATASSADTRVQPVSAEPAQPPQPPSSEPGFAADYLHNPAPGYPPASRRNGEEGRVLLRVRVSAAGLAEAVEVYHGSGFSRLDEAAREVVAGWRFIPARRGGSAIASSVIVPITFRLGH